MEKQTKTATEIRLTWSELADKLAKEQVLELSEGQTLVIHQIDSGDLIAAVEEADPSKRLGVLVEIMKRYSLELFFVGSLHLGPFQLTDHSWALHAGETGSVRIIARPLTVRKTIGEVVSFLSKLPSNQAIVLKPFQELFLEDLSRKDMFNYYEFCQEETDPIKREKEQDALFVRNCKGLEENQLLLKVYGFQVKQVDRSVDTHAGGMLFKPISDENNKEPRLVIGLTSATPNP